MIPHGSPDVSSNHHSGDWPQSTEGQCGGAGELCQRREEEKEGVDSDVTRRVCMWTGGRSVALTIETFPHPERVCPSEMLHVAKRR